MYIHMHIRSSSAECRRVRPQRPSGVGKRTGPEVVMPKAAGAESSSSQVASLPSSSSGYGPASRGTSASSEPFCPPLRRDRSARRARTIAMARICQLVKVNTPTKPSTYRFN